MSERVCKHCGVRENATLRSAMCPSTSVWSPEHDFSEPKAAPPAGEEMERARAGKAWQGENGLGGMLQHDAYIRGWLARALAGDGKEGKR